MTLIYLFWLRQENGQIIGNLECDNCCDHQVGMSGGVVQDAKVTLVGVWFAATLVLSDNFLAQNVEKGNN